MKPKSEIGRTGIIASIGFREEQERLKVVYRTIGKLSLFLTTIILLVIIVLFRFNHSSITFSSMIDYIKVI